MSRRPTLIVDASERQLAALSAKAGSATFLRWLWKAGPSALRETAVALLGGALTGREVPCGVVARPSRRVAEWLDLGPAPRSVGLANDGADLDTTPDRGDLN